MGENLECVDSSTCPHYYHDDHFKNRGYLPLGLRPFYNVTRNVGVLYPTTDVMDTFVYRALLDSGNIGMSSAASFIQSIVCFVTITLANTVVKKIDKEKALF